MGWTKAQLKLARQRYQERVRKSKPSNALLHMLFKLVFLYVLLKSRIVSQVLFQVVHLYLRYTILCFLVVYFVEKNFKNHYA